MNAATDTPSTGPAAGRPRGRALTVLASLLALIIAVVALAAAWMGWQEARRGAESGAAEGAQIDRLSERVDRLAAELEATRSGQKRVDDELAALDRKQSAAADAIAGLLEASRQTSLDWALSEIEYLLVIATHRLQLLHDVPTALAAMQAAANRLDNLHEPGLTDLHMQLASDMDALKAVKDVDISGLTLYLTDLADRADRLPLGGGAGGAPPGAPSAEPAPDSGWRGVLLSIWREFRSLVVVTRSKTGAGATLLPDEKYFLYQNLRLQLETARLAVVRRDTHTLRASLTAAGEWLKTYFDADSEDVTNILESFARMQQVDLDPALPDISSSLETLRAFIRSRPSSSAPPDADPGPAPDAPPEATP